MEQYKIERINELARKAKTVGLSASEKEEQALLRGEYIKAYRENLRSQLENMDIKNPDGSIVSVKSLRKNRPNGH